MVKIIYKYRAICVFRKGNVTFQRSVEKDQRQTLSVGDKTKNKVSNQTEKNLKYLYLTILFKVKLRLKKKTRIMKNIDK